VMRVMVADGKNKLNVEFHSACQNQQGHMISDFELTLRVESTTSPNTSTPTAFSGISNYCTDSYC
jgi:hypothetical protein